MVQRPGLTHAGALPLAVTATWTNVVGDALMDSHLQRVPRPHTTGSKKWYPT